MMTLESSTMQANELRCVTEARITQTLFGGYPSLPLRRVPGLSGALWLLIERLTH
jgi:hypothetical protein